jgi:hypothetical protein
MRSHLFQRGELNAAGAGFNPLNGPYDAKQVGEFAGLTRLFDEFRSVRCCAPHEAPNVAGLLLCPQAWISTIR